MLQFLVEGLGDQRWPTDLFLKSEANNLALQFFLPMINPILDRGVIDTRKFLYFNISSVLGREAINKSFRNVSLSKPEPFFNMGSFVSVKLDKWPVWEGNVFSWNRYIAHKKINVVSKL